MSLALTLSQFLSFHFTSVCSSFHFSYSWLFCCLSCSDYYLHLCSFTTSSTYYTITKFNKNISGPSISFRKHHKNIWNLCPILVTNLSDSGHSKAILPLDSSCSLMNKWPGIPFILLDETPYFDQRERQRTISISCTIFLVFLSLLLL